MHDHISLWVNLIIFYLIHRIGSTQRPHDHLFQNSWHLGATCVHKQVERQHRQIWVYFFMIVIKYITRLVIWVNLFTVHVIHHNVIIQRPHDHLFQMSWHLDATLVLKLVSEQKSTNLRFFLYDCNQVHYHICYMGQFVHIICNS